MREIGILIIESILILEFRFWNKRVSVFLFYTKAAEKNGTIRNMYVITCLRTLSTLSCLSMDSFCSILSEYIEETFNRLYVIKYNLY